MLLLLNILIVCWIVGNGIAYQSFLGLIVDGNGRWAQRRNLPRSAGHTQGANVTFQIIESLYRENVPFITLYLFSTENWSRPALEIHHIFELLNSYLLKYMDYFVKEAIEVVTIGQLDRLPPLSQQIIREVIQRTSTTRPNRHQVSLPRKVLCFALNYGGRSEILQACEQLSKERRRIAIDSPISEEDFEKHLFLSNYHLPPPDLIIRTSGEKRLSNFLLWHAAYSELAFTDTLWPDFSTEELVTIIESFRHRSRRFGGI